MAKRHIKRCPTLLITREIQIKTTMSYHLIPVRMVIIKKSTNLNTGEDGEKREPSYIVGKNVNCYNHYREQYGSLLKKSKNRTAI